MRTVRARGPGRTRRAGRGAPGVDVAVDLGTATTRIAVQGAGVVLDEPSVVALDGRERLVAAGGLADAAGEERGVLVVRPVGRSAVRDPAAATALLRALLDRADVGRRPRSRLALTVPSSATPVERRAREAVGRDAGTDVVLVEGPRVAALGTGAPRRPLGSMVLDLGAGTTEAAVLGLGAVVASRLTRLGLDDLDAAVRDRLRRHHGLDVGEATATAVRTTLGSAAGAGTEPAAEVRGREVVSGSPAVAVLEADEVHATLADGIEAVEATALACLAAVPPELARDVTHAGLLLVGGGGLLPGLPERLAAATDLPVSVPAAPRTCAVLGALATIAT